jgi:hypothetical protein
VSALPKVVASSVIRGSQLGESHGGLYLVNLDDGTAEQTLDWNRTDIDVSGRGGDRGLRGIAFHADRILVASNAALLILDREFQVLESHTHRYLQHCHEICVVGDHVFLTSTGFDSLLTFDLRSRRFSHGFHLGAEDSSLKVRQFDPQGSGPAPSRRFHLNSIQANANDLWFSGLHTPGLLHLSPGGLSLASPLPSGTHNATQLQDGVIYNDTQADCVCYQNSSGETLRMPVPAYDAAEILNLDRFESSVARPGFARGLCLLDAEHIAAGSSPSTICVYRLSDGRRVAQCNLSMDVRNAIHGLAVWPY